MQKKNSKERRRHKRTPADIKAQYRRSEEEEYSKGTIKNISQSGMLLEGEKAASQEDDVHIVALDPPDKDQFQATARVAWCCREVKELKTEDVADSFLLGLEVIKKIDV